MKYSEARLYVLAGRPAHAHGHDDTKHLHLQHAHTCGTAMLDETLRRDIESFTYLAYSITSCMKINIYKLNK